MDYEILSPQYDGIRDYVLSNQDELRKKYGNKFVAIVGAGTIIDSDDDQSLLESRLRQQTHKDLKPLIGTIDDLLSKSRKISTTNPQ